MCGISGFNWQDRVLVEKMSKSIKHRGPDDSGVFVDDKYSLSHTRLSILDLSERGHQPMEFDGLIIVYNGEVYNFKEIRCELEECGYSFFSDSDTEVVLKAYHEWGSECLKRFNGMFSFAIYNKNNNNIFLARDRIGIKPLYYYYKNNKFIFSSEMKAILDCHSIDKEVVPERLSYIADMSCLPGELTMFKYVYQLPAANYLLFDGNKLKSVKYWQIEDFEDIKDRNYIKQEIYRLAEKSVKLRMISDVPVGVFLSGGIDSSVIAMIAQKYSNNTIKTFSVGFETDFESEKYNADFLLARRTAKYLGTDHNELFLKKGQVLEYVKELADNIEMPSSMTTAVPSYYLSKFAKKKVSVVLGGDGGDELFGGYDRYRLSLIASKWQSQPGILRKLIPLKVLGKMVNKDLSRLEIDRLIDRYVDLKFHKNPDATALFGKRYVSDLAKGYVQDTYFNMIKTDDFEKYFMNVDRQTWLVDHSLIRTDKTTMSFGLEERIPLLDHEMVELSCKIPTKYKVDLFNTKKIFKETFKSELPSFLYIQPKRGWLAPAAKWLRGELKEFAYEVLSDNFVKLDSEIIDLKEARKILDRHISGERYNLHLLWIAISWQLFSKRYL